MTTHGYTTPDTIRTEIDNTLIHTPITHPDGCTALLRQSYALVIAAELDHLASAGPLLTPDLLLDRARFLRDGARREAIAVAERYHRQEATS